jgi:hypothetical protein
LRTPNDERWQVARSRDSLVSQFLIRNS